MIRQRCWAGKCSRLSVVLLLVADVFLVANGRSRNGPIWYLTSLHASASATCIAGKVVWWRERHLARQGPRIEGRHNRRSKRSRKNARLDVKQLQHLVSSETTA